MKNLRSIALGMIVLPFAGGCASTDCEYLDYETPPQQSRPLIMPEGVPAPAESGEYRVPEIANATPPRATGNCIAEPPQTLPPEALRDPEDGEEG